MGRDKALLEFNGQPLIRRAVEKLQALGISPRIAGSRSDLSRFATAIPDNFPDSGPLGGIDAALAISDARLNLFQPVDLPWLPTDLLAWMVERAESTESLATIPRLQGRLQPLCAVYHREFWPYARAALMTGNFKVMDAVNSAAIAKGFRIDCFDVENIATALGWRQPNLLHRWFDNLNTPADLEKAALEQSASIQ
jgi:molybdopterin-guanine dinucleotide biosynthesis protein A